MPACRKAVVLFATGLRKATAFEMDFHVKGSFIKLGSLYCKTTFIYIFFLPCSKLTQHV